MGIQTVAVTGGNGRVGSAVITELQQCGYETANISRSNTKSRVLSDNIVADRYVSADLLSVGDTYEALAQVGADAVIHTATVYNPDYHVKTETYESNVMTSYNILQAATDLGIETVCLVSSLAVMGWSFGAVERQIDYLPLDEEHPVIPCEPYGLGKHVMEETAEGFGRVDEPPTTITSLRFPWVANDDEIQDMLVNRDRGLDAVLDADEPFTADSLFAYIHVSDAAKAARKAIEADFDGHERIFAAASGTTSEASTRELISACYPEAEVRAPIDTHSGLISTTKAKRLLNWSATKSWRRI